MEPPKFAQLSGPAGWQWSLLWDYTEAHPPGVQECRTQLETPQALLIQWKSRLKAGLKKLYTIQFVFNGSKCQRWYMIGSNIHAPPSLSRVPSATSYYRLLLPIPLCTFNLSTTNHSIIWSWYIWRRKWVYFSRHVILGLNDPRAQGQEEIETTGRLNISDWEVENQVTAISEPVFLSLIQCGYVYTAFFNPYFECMQKYS